METTGISRRDVLKTLTLGVAGGGGLQVIPLEAAELAHQMVHKEKQAAPAGKYTPKFFTAKQYEAISWLCDSIIPKDDKSGGALDAGAPEFIDLLTSENEDYQLALGGGLMWLETRCVDQYGRVFMECAPEQRKELLDLIAFRKNARKDAGLSQGVAFFAFLRKMTCDGYYTSKVGIADLQYIGNVTRSAWLGCPPLPE